MPLGNAGGGRTTGIEAQQDGECAECFDGIEAGDRITKTPAGWAHVRCPETTPGPNASRWDGTDDESMGY